MGEIFSFSFYTNGGPGATAKFSAASIDRVKFSSRFNPPSDGFAVADDSTFHLSAVVLTKAERIPGTPTRHAIALASAESWARATPSESLIS
jgi:hypothetical protein